MRRPRAEARALIARLKVHGVAFDSARRAVVFIDSDVPGIGQQRLAPFAGSHRPTACAWAMGR